MPERLPNPMPVARITFLIVCLAAAIARAQPADPPPPDAPAPAPAESKPWAIGVTAEEQAIALGLFEQGNAEFVELHYAQALAKYREALTHWDHPAIRFNIAVCLINLEQLLEANENLDKALRFGAPALGVDVHQQALTLQKLLQSQLAHLKLSCKEPGAIVSLDGKQRFIAPGSVELDLLPGDHIVVATKPGFLNASEKVDLRAGKQASVDVRLIAFKSATITTRRWTPWKPWAVVAGGLLVTGVGVLTFGLAVSNLDDYDEIVKRECPAGCTAVMSRELELQGYLDRSRTEEGSAYALFGIGGTIAVAGAIAVVLNLPQTKLMLDQGPRVTASPSGGTASFSWHF